MSANPWEALRGPEVYRSPWWNCNGYRATTVRYADGSKRTVLEHREVMEAIVGRTLRSDEHVHHRDENQRNNDPSNLEILSRSEHARHHNTTGLEMWDLACIRCGAKFSRPAHQERGHRKKGKRGPFCGKRCSGADQRARQLATGDAKFRSGGRHPAAEGSLR